MPLQKDFKRVVRARMQKTGESYTTARANLLRRRGSDPAAVPAAPRPDYAALAGMSDSAISGKTGRDWAGWVRLLDGLGAHAWPHRRIAETVHAEYGVREWWTQAVTVGYERIKGLREIGQQDILARRLRHATGGEFHRDDRLLDGARGTQAHPGGVGARARVERKGHPLVVQTDLALQHIRFKAQTVARLAAIQFERNHQVQRLAYPGAARRPPDGQGRRLERSADQEKAGSESQSLQGSGQ